MKSLYLENKDKEKVHLSLFYKDNIYNKERFFSRKI
jgi:hypothetical protein